MTSDALPIISIFYCTHIRWELVSKIDTRRAGAGVAVVECQINQLKDVTKCTLAASGILFSVVLCDLEF